MNKDSRRLLLYAAIFVAIYYVMKYGAGQATPIDRLSGQPITPDAWQAWQLVK